MSTGSFFNMKRYFKVKSLSKTSISFVKIKISCPRIMIRFIFDVSANLCSFSIFNVSRSSK